MSLIVGILLAAGASRRFGADKLTQILPNGELVAVQACRNLLAGTDSVLAVVRPGSKRLATVLRAEGASVVTCTDAEQGMSRSLIFGIRSCPDATGWLIGLADMPWIDPVTISQVANALRLGATIAAPSWQGRRGHPVGFSQALGPELTTLKGDEGAKILIQSYLEQLQIITCNDSGILCDIDKPEDLNPSKKFKKHS
ncbi:NTP transferase domain-containing protein [Methylobacter sp. S3L5C]|uniref:nucleotidyltransferase family protein n=1 Tax=Methylobacter sp. S3L5C TaxID=2839024 RepID=UPI001FABFDE2|nr:nucleotidyltransferase family protein [Methylobacter sp. S3L5C]UOA07232.1 nucleotidyltransferase family protein [Methylobacter sp. S3L5C]